MAGMKKFNCPDSVLPESWGAPQSKSADPIPRDVLFRALSEAPELRAAAEGGMPTLHGHFAVFNKWTEIDSIFEGRFLEQLAPGAFAKTIKENRANMRVLFQHGKDPQIGNKPLGPIDVLEEDATGARYEVPLLDTTYNRDLIPGLEKGLYGASFRFRVTREDVNNKPERSSANPDGIPERTIREVQLQEFGPVTSGPTSRPRPVCAR
jgi:HK97 family phage prohead protease